jgi:serine O-acetyltransferase
MSLKFFRADLQAACKSASFATQLKWFFLNHTLHLVFWIRLGQDLRKIPVLGKVFGILIEYFIRVVYASDISCRARIAAGFVVMHGHGIVIGADVVIGEGCKIFNGVTLGNKDFTQASAGNQPVVGRNSTLCTGAKILGNIRIGDNVVVGANSVVLRDCPANSVVAGVPAVVIRRHI